MRHGHAAGTAVKALGRHLKGHVFLFEAKSPPAYDPPAGLRLLLIFLLLEVAIGPRLSLLSLVGLPLPPSCVRVPVLLGLALISIRFFARLTLSQIGLYPWRGWSGSERSYFVQVFLIANAVFAFLFADRLRMILADSAGWGRAAIVALTYFLWGFYQELVYRGVLQTEVVRRWGSLSGILVSNSLYTFGPMHFYHFSGAAPTKAMPMFVGIFAIGLFFGVLFRRSGNLGMVGILHGLGDCYITGLTPS